MYKIFEREFETFEDVVRYAWDIHKLEFMDGALEMIVFGTLDEETKQICCRELEDYERELQAARRCDGGCSKCAECPNKKD